jgi:hypothetical protein
LLASSVYSISTFFFSSDQQVGEASLLERRSFRFIKDAKLWYAAPSPSESESTSRSENVIVLSEEFCKEIQEHPIPVDLAVVKALADSPGNLDLYVWLVWRCWTAKGAVSIPLFGPDGLVSLTRDLGQYVIQFALLRDLVRGST